MAERRFGPPTDECANCIVFGWKGKKPDDLPVLQTCSQCKVLQYCSRECQEQHWTAVHKRHCKDLARASPYVHDSRTCSYCLDSKNPNCKYVCFAKEFNSPITPFSPHPFPIEGVPEDKSEALIILMQRLLLEMKLSNHPICTCRLGREMVQQLEEDLSMARTVIWFQRKTYPPKDKVPMFGISGELFGETKGLHGDDSLGLWSTLRLVWSILIDQHIALNVEHFKDPREAAQFWPDGLSDDCSQFKAVVDRLSEVKEKILPFPKILEIFCGGSLAQNCSTCNKAIIVSGVSGCHDTRDKNGHHQIAFHGEPVVYARPFLPRVFSCGTSFECAKRAAPQCWYNQWAVAVDDTAGSDLNSKRCDFCYKLVSRVHRCKKCWTKQWCGDECMMLDWGGKGGHRLYCREDADMRKVKVEK